MEVLEPEQDVGSKKAHYLGAREVELVRSPVGVNLVFVEHMPIERGETMGICAKSAGDPVHDDADTCLVGGIDKLHELLRRPKARRGSVVARCLIAP